MKRKFEKTNQSWFSPEYQSTSRVDQDANYPNAGATQEEAVTANKRAEEWQAKYEAAAHESSSKDFKLDQQRFFFEQNMPR